MYCDTSILENSFQDCIRPISKFVTFIIQVQKSYTTIKMGFTDTKLVSVSTFPDTC